MRKENLSSKIYKAKKSGRKKRSKIKDQKEINLRITLVKKITLIKAKCENKCKKKEKKTKNPIDILGENVEDCSYNLRMGSPYDYKMWNL